MTQTPPSLTFTDAERTQLEKLRGAIARRTSQRHASLDFCADDGDEWAAISLTDAANEGHAVLVSFQLARAGQFEGSRAIAVMAANGHLSPRIDLSADLQALLPAAERAAMVEFRTQVPHMRWHALAACVPARDLNRQAAALGLPEPASGASVRSRPRRTS